MNAWHRLHLWSWWLRWPLKLAAFMVVVVLVLYPKVWLLPRWVGRLHDMNATLQPDHPALGELAEMVRARGGEGRSAVETLRVVQQVVYERIPYAWDWDVWGVVDYLPTTAEVLQKGREDCDGRAVLAASLLRRLGYQAWLVSDIKHTWVATPGGETMSPGRGQKTFEGGEGGTRMRVTGAALVNLGRSLTYGIAVFPLTRELIILAALCGLTMHPRASVRRRVAGCLLLVLALGLLHDSGAAPGALAHQPMLAWAGLVTGVVGWLVLAIRAGGPHSHPERPE